MITLAEWPNCCPTAAAMSISVPKINSTGRSTYCDIMCISNTEKVFEEAKEKKKSRKMSDIRANLPYKKPENLINPLKIADPTPMQRLKQSQFKKVLNQELHVEREEFLAKLSKDRMIKHQLEKKSAIIIQSTFRGFRTRKYRFGMITASRKPLKVALTPDVISAELCTWAIKLGLKPIPGLSLISKSAQRKRKAKFQFAAAIKLQCFFRMLVCKIKFKRKKSFRNAQKTIQAAMQINRFFKWVHRITRRAREELAIRRKAVVKIQNCFRKWKSRLWYVTS